VSRQARLRYTSRWQRRLPALARHRILMRRKARRHGDEAWAALAASDVRKTHILRFAQGRRCCMAARSVLGRGYFAIMRILRFAADFHKRSRGKNPNWLSSGIAALTVTRGKNEIFFGGPWARPPWHRATGRARACRGMPLSVPPTRFPCCGHTSAPARWPLSTKPAGTQVYRAEGPAAVP